MQVCETVARMECEGVEKEACTTMREQRCSPGTETVGATCIVSRVSCHVYHVSCHVSRVSCHVSRYYEQVCVDTLEQECGLVQDVLCRNVTETRSVSVIRQAISS